MKQPKYKLGEKVYHITPDSEIGIITDIIYHYNLDYNVYEISTGFDKNFYCDEFELTREKTF